MVQSVTVENTRKAIAELQARRKGIDEQLSILYVALRGAVAADRAQQRVARVAALRSQATSLLAQGRQRRDAGKLADRDDFAFDPSRAEEDVLRAFIARMRLLLYGTR